MHRKVKCKKKKQQNQEVSVRDSFMGERGWNQIVNWFETPIKLTSDPTIILTWLNTLLHRSFDIEERHTSLVISFVYLVIHSFLSAILLVFFLFLSFILSIVYNYINHCRGHVQSTVFWNKNNIMELTLEVNCFGFIILEYLQNYLKKECCDLW